MAVPYTFGSATSSIPLSQLDSNFATTITLGNTAIQLGNTVTTLNNMTLANVTVQTGNVTIGQANAVVYTNSSNVATANATVLAFDGTNLGVGTSSPSASDWNASATVVQVKKNDTNGGLLKASSSNTDFIFSAGNNLAYIATTTNTPLLFYTNTTERARFNTTGALVLAGGTTTADGIGITFPASQSASTNANTLDDYEEGTFTPTFNGTGSNPTVTYNGQSGNYIKIGRLCFVNMAVGWTSFSGGSGSVRIGNLPFEPSQSNNMRAVGSMPFTSGLTGLTTGASIQPHTNLASAAAGTYFYMKDSVGNQVAYLDVTNIASSGNIQVALVYYTTN